MTRKVLTSLVLLTFLCTSNSVASKKSAADYIEPITGMQFMSIPGGTFIMGDENDSFARPEHEVTVQPFLMGRYEVTFEQYATYCSSTGKMIPSDNGWGMKNRPIVNVTWEEAVAFTEWLTEQSGKTFRLPSEAEWEYAAKAGSTTKYPWGDDIGMNKANCNKCGSQWDGRMTAPVGAFPPNAYGLYEMVGNVYEWCLDLKHDSYEGAPTDGSAWLTDPSDNRRINRGGSWLQRPVDAEVTARCWEDDDRKQKDYGFRVLIEVE